jgi:hypothetical protein
VDERCWSGFHLNTQSSPFDSRQSPFRAAEDRLPREPKLDRRGAPALALFLISLLRLAAGVSLTARGMMASRVEAGSMEENELTEMLLASMVRSIRCYKRSRV